MNAAPQVLVTTPEVSQRDGSVFALGACSSDDGGEEASALWRSHQHGGLVLVDDLDLVSERGRVVFSVCLSVDLIHSIRPAQQIPSFL